MTDADTNTVQVTDVHRTYGAGDSAVRALRGVSLSIDRGELVALTGPSGSGKTTLLNALLGLDQADSGTIEVFGTLVHELAYEAAVDWRRSNIAIVFQQTGLLPHLTARENVDVVLRIRGIDGPERTRRINETFEQLEISAFGDHRPGEISGGQRQRVSLARALATRPSLLVADEPTGELDTETTVTVLDVLRAARDDHGITMVLATHDRELEAIADRTLRMVDGSIAP